ncbi:MAG: carboxypeptidase regulatory-like domain-containing protein [Thermoplasmatota archaeon]
MKQNGRPMRRLGIAITVVLLAAAMLGAVAAFLSPVSSAGSTPSSAPQGTLFLDQQTLGTQNQLMAFDTTKRAVFDLTGSGTPDIITDDDNGHIYVIRGTDGALLSELSTFHPAGWGSRDMNDIAVGDVYGDGRMDIVSVNSVGFLTLFQLNKTQSTPDKLVWDTMWSKNLDPRIYWGPAVEQRRPWYNWSPQYPGNDGAAYLADVDGNGKLTIFVENDNMPGFWAINPDGSVRWAIDWSDGAAGPWVDDVFGTGHQSAVFATDGGDVYIFDARNGALQSQFHTMNLTGPCQAERPASISVWPSVVDIDGSGQKEILFGTRAANGTEADAANSAWTHAQHAKIYAERPNGTLLWCFSAPWMDPHVCMHPAVVTVNGQTEIIYMDWNTIGHLPGTFQAVNPPHLFALDPQGNLLWVDNLSTPWSNTDVAVADVYGNGQQDILADDNEGGQDGLGVFNLQGHHVGFIPAQPGWSVTRGPEVADLRNDGHLEIILPVHQQANDCTVSLNIGCRHGAMEIIPIQGTTAAFPGVVDLNAQYDNLYGRVHTLPWKAPQVLPTISTGTLSGTIRDPSGPIAGGTVQIKSANGTYSTVADVHGVYSIRAPPGTYAATASGFDTNSTTAMVTLAPGRVTEWDPLVAGGPLTALNPAQLHAVPGPGPLELLAGVAVVSLVVGRGRRRTRR